MPSSSVELSVVLPALDEEAGLRRLLPGLKDALRELGVSHEVIVVDGGSLDKTREAAEESGARVILQKRPGFSGALRDGFEHARGERILVMDADGSHSPSCLRSLWERRHEGDLIIASRFVPGGSADMPPARYWLSRLLNLVTRIVLDLPARDASSGFRLYRAAAVRGVAPRTRDFSVQQELLARIAAAGGKAVEVPFHYAPRVGGESKASVLRFAGSYLRLFWEVLRIREGDAALKARGAVLLLGLSTGLWGLSWGLPGPARLRVLPEGRPLSAEAAQRLSDAWARLYEEIERSHARLDPEEPVTYLKGAAEFPAGWDFPAGALANSWRSFLLQAVQPDEKKAFIILARMRPWKLDFEPLYAQYGGAFIYPLGAWLWAASKLGAATLVADMRHYLQHPADMGRLYLLGRIFVFVFHLAGLWVIFSLGRRLSGWKTGAAASGLWALVPAAALAAHQVKPHPVALFWGLVSLHAVLRAAECGRRRHFLACGLAASLAAGSSLLYLPFLGLPVLALAFRRDKTKEALLAVGAGLAVLAALNPYLVFSHEAFAWELGVYGGEKHRLSAAALRSLAVSSGLAAGFPLIVVSAAGVAASFFRGGERRLLGAVSVLMAGAVLFRFGEFTDPGVLRLYLLPLAVGVVLGVDFLHAKRSAAAAALLFACVVDTGVRGLSHLKALGREAGTGATRFQAADWISANIPAGDSIGLSRYPEPSSTPPIPFHRWTLVLADDPEVLAARGPRWLLADESRRPFMDRAARNGYDLAASFPSEGLGWARPADPAAFADPGFFVWKKR